MPDPSPKSSVPEFTEVTQANVLAEAAATMAAQAAAKAAAAKAKAEEALARAAALRAGTAVPAAAAETAPAPVVEVKASPPVAPATKPAPVEVKAAPAPAPASVAPAQTKAQPAPAEERRAGSERRGDEERRINDDRRTGAPDPRPQSDRVERRSPEGRRTTPNPGRRATDLTADSGIIRLGEAVRAASSARAADRRALSTGPVRAAGSVLEPEAHRAGLGTAGRKKRRGISPGLILLFGLMVFFGMYATGHLPQFDQLTDAAVKDSQAHNDQVVGTIANNWHMFAYIAAGVCVVLIAFLVINSIRARAHENAD
jgi:hypothetical protein